LSWKPDDPEVEARRRRRYRPASDGETLRRITVTAVVAAVSLNVVLFFQTAVSQLSPGDVSAALVSLVSSVFPGASGLQPPSRTPLPSPQYHPVATTGAS
jgi:hypothetical protein